MSGPPVWGAPTGGPSPDGQPSSNGHQAPPPDGDHQDHEPTQRVAAPPPVEEKKPRKPKPARELPNLGRYLQFILVATLATTAGLTLLRYFSDRGYLIAVGAAAVGATVLAGLAATRRWPAWVTILLGVGGFLVVGVFAVFRSTLRHGIPTWDTVTSFLGSIGTGWSRMIMVGLPADPAGDLVVTPALITWVAAFVATVLAVRTRTPLSPLAPLLVAFGLDLVLSAGRPVGGLVLVGALVAQVLLLALVRAGDDMTIGRRKVAGLTLGVPVILVAVAAGLVGAQALPLATGDDRFDLREVVPVPLDIGDGLSPLSTLKGQLREPQHDLFTVGVSGDTADIDRVRTVTLDRFDGALWTSSDRFLLAGHTLPVEDDLTASKQVSLSFAIGDMTGPYLPEAGAPVRVTANRVAFSEDSGTLATDAPTLAGLTYRLDAELPGRQGLADAVPAPDADTARYTDLPPGLPPEVAAKGSQLAGAVAAPYQKLMAIQDYLQKLPYNLDSRPGHSYDAVRRLFSPNPADQVGYAEQFASAFAVLARSQGFPTRVAVGYLLNPQERKGDTYTVSSKDAHAWAEVKLAGYGWVTFEPTDPQRHAGTTPKQPETDTGQQHDKQDDQTKASQPVEDPSLPKVATSTLTPLDWALFVAIGLGVLLVLTPIAVAAEKVRRRRMRRTGSRAAKIIGAWQESADRLVEHGVPVTAAHTAVEVAGQAQERLGEEVGAVAVLAPIVTAAISSPDEPEEQAVTEAWRLDAQLGRELRKVRGTFATARAWLDPRPLFTRRHDRKRRRRALEHLTRG
jgi:transglutaminase superfamily protein/transglutaminase TgpA-like protein